MALFEQYNKTPWLTPVRLVATSNQSGTYFNGAINNGVGATLTYATGVSQIDSVTPNVGDRVLLQAQSSAFQNGIYVVLVVGATGIAQILQRAADQQCIEQLMEGQYVTVGAGTVNAGSAFVLVEPFPAAMGTSNIVWTASPLNSGLGTAAAKNASDNTKTNVASVSAATVANEVAVFQDTAGTVGDGTTASTLSGGALTVSGNVAAGKSGTAGAVSSFSSTATTGSLVLAALANSGNFTTTISNAAQAQSTVYSIGDIGASTGGLVAATTAVRMKVVAAAAVAGGSGSNTVTDAFCTTSSVVLAAFQTSTNAVSIQKVTAGAGSFVLLTSADPGSSTLNYVILK